MALLLIIAIIIIVVLAINNGKLGKEIYELKKQLQAYSSGQEIPSNIYQRQNITQKSSVEKIQPSAVTKKEKTTSSFEDRKKSKNILILISGSILIVLSAIVFLATTWNTIPDLLKTITLTLLIGVFLGASYIAKNNFKLDQTAKAFYYLAMLYVPIVLLSISLFKLFGEFLSITGEGRNLYFSISSIALSILYLGLSIKGKGKPLIILSLLFQILAVIFTTLIFTSDSTILTFAIILYSFAINRIFKEETLEKLNLKEYTLVFWIEFFAISVFVIITMLIKLLSSECVLFDFINISILTLNFYLTKFNNKKIKVCYDVGILFSILVFINIVSFNILFNYKFFIMSASTLILYLLNYLNASNDLYKRLIYKIIVYVSLNFVCLSVLAILELFEYVKYITLVTTLICIITEKLKRDENIKYYLIISFIMTFLSLNVTLSISSFIALLIGCLMFYLYIKKEKLNELYLIIPAISILPSIYFSDILVLKTAPTSLHFNRIISFILILLVSTKSIFNKKASIYTFLSIGYISLSALVLNLNIYINIFLFLIWSIIHILFHEKNDIYKVIAYISGLMLYNKIIADLELNTLTVLNTFGYIACTYLISRTVIVKYGPVYKFVEYLCSSIIYLYSLATFKDITDAMIFITFLFILTVIGYKNKVGPMFLTSLIAILIHVINLTKEFWQSIPWYIYLLVIGSALIIFAIKNELNEKNNSKTLSNKFKQLKDSIDL